MDSKVNVCHIHPVRLTDPDNTVIIGIDPSSKKVASMTGVLRPDGSLKLVDHSLVVLAEKYSPEAGAKALELAWDLVGVARAYGKPHVWIEAPLVGRGGVRTTIVQSYINGALQAAFAFERVPVETVVQNTWKASLGHGGASKSDVQRMVGEQWVEAATAAAGSEDLADAAGIAIHGAQARRRAEHLMEEALGLRA